VVEHLPVKCKTLSLNNKKEELLTTYLQWSIFTTIILYYYFYCLFPYGKSTCGQM
jgi:hypothetical protein